MQKIPQEIPLNVAPDLNNLIAEFQTHDDVFFVRNHGNIPQLTAENYRLHIDGHVREPLTLSLNQILTQFPSHSISATLTCAGNRREELHALQEIRNEIIWGLSAISNAGWRGVLLRDILKAAGADFNPSHHIAFEGYDDIVQDQGIINFGASIEMTKALEADVVLAYEMNDETLSPKRGYPIRLVVPGYIGARSVKWLRSIRIQDTPSDNYYQQKAYRKFGSEVVETEANWLTAPMLTEQALNAIICTPEYGSSLDGSALRIAGFALPQGDNYVTRVEVSTDGGHNWSEARITTPTHPHTWCFWEASATLAPGKHELVARAYDSGGNAQPAELQDVWNFKGYMNNAWHRIEFLVTG